MPLAWLKGSEGLMGPPRMKSVIAGLPAIIADALSSEDPDGQLTSDDIEVEIKVDHPLDHSNFDLTLIVLANHYQGRYATLDSRRAKLQDAFQTLLTDKGFEGLSCFVWVLLLPGSFGTFDLPI